MATDNFSVTSPGQRKKYRRRRGPPSLKSLEAYGTTAHHGMTSPEQLHRGRTPSLESMDDDMSHITFEDDAVYVPDSTLSHAELKSWHTSLHNESGGARSLAIYGELRHAEALMLNGGDKPHSVMAAVSGDLLPKLTTPYRQCFENFTIAPETQLRCVFAGLRSYHCPELSRASRGDAGANDALVRCGLAAERARLVGVQGDGVPKSRGRRAVATGNTIRSRRTGL